MSSHLGHLLSACLQAASVGLHTKCCWRPGTTAPKTLHTRAAAIAAGKAGEACWQSCCRCPGPCTSTGPCSLHRALCQCSMCTLQVRGGPPAELLRHAIACPMAPPRSKVLCCMPLMVLSEAHMLVHTLQMYIRHSEDPVSLLAQLIRDAVMKVPADATGREMHKSVDPFSSEHSSCRSAIWFIP